MCSVRDHVMIAAAGSYWVANISLTELDGSPFYHRSRIKHGLKGQTCTHTLENASLIRFYENLHYGHGILNSFMPTVDAMYRTNFSTDTLLAIGNSYTLDVIANSFGMRILSDRKAVFCVRRLLRRQA